mmetsp:Transcript_109592/g.223973  ORF Transcript_109592/g.223973 Transcript_109592/m.223973 type:complete len:298 (-) Transcript_109592:814-1707(-)
MGRAGPVASFPPFRFVSDSSEKSVVPVRKPRRTTKRQKKGRPAPRTHPSGLGSFHNIYRNSPCKCGRVYIALRCWRVVARMDVRAASKEGTRSCSLVWGSRRRHALATAERRRKGRGGAATVRLHLDGCRCRRRSLRSNGTAALVPLVVVGKIERDREFLVVPVPVGDQPSRVLVEGLVGYLEGDRLVGLGGKQNVLVPLVLREVDLLLEGRHEPVAGTKVLPDVPVGQLEGQAPLVRVAVPALEDLVGRPADLDGLAAVLLLLLLLRQRSIDPALWCTPPCSRQLPSRAPWFSGKN